MKNILYIYIYISSVVTIYTISSKGNSDQRTTKMTKQKQTDFKHSPTKLDFLALSLRQQEIQKKIGQLVNILKYITDFVVQSRQSSSYFILHSKHKTYLLRFKKKVFCYVQELLSFGGRTSYGHIV